MTKQETVEVVTLIVMSYPAAEKLKDENTIKAMVGVWSQFFKDDDKQIVSLAVQKHIATRKFPPNIAEIREQMVLIARPEIIPPDQAWAAVSDLMYGVGQFNYGDLHAQLPPLIARAVEVIGYDNLWEMHRAGVRGGSAGLDRVAFIQQYTPMYERERERAMLPAAISEAVSKTEKALGGKAVQLLEAAHQKREDEEKLMERFLRRERSTS